MPAESPTPSDPAVAVVTVSYGSGDVLSGFLDSVPAASGERVLVIVADNKPDGDDGVAELAARHGADYLPLPANLGYGGAMNAASKTLPASVRWILVSNPDVVLRKSAIDRLVAVGEQDETIGSIGPVIVDGDGGVYPSARSVPSLRTGVGHALFVNLWAGNPWTRAYRRDTTNELERRDAGWLSGACVLVRRSAFDRLGGFDEGYFMYFEDVDLGYRLGKAGYRNVYEPSAVVVHTGAHSTNTDSERMIRVHHESARRFLNRKYADWYLWPVRVVLSVGLFARSLVIGRRVRHR